ncbi:MULTISPECIES: hypothetical protein [Sphingobium]|uniref:Uncharacterized protein n=1 Tax=Sphingobium tyrosinilyticum TaxID=2715436 RepID=A0ABV9F2A3_9SPHN|nr:hypothetical protein [Sphingobium sp. EP60837]ANI79897.1 hypothetical protein EP837_03513 [Sphingobium sp. EP60837]
MRFLLLIGLTILASCGSGDKKQDTATPSLTNQVETPQAAPALPISSPASQTPPPADFKMPDFAPLYPGAKIQSLNSASDDSNHEVRLLTTDDAAKVVAFYRDRFAAAGMKKTSEFLSGGTAMMSAIGKDRQASIAITKETGHNAVIVTYSGE